MSGNGRGAGFLRVAAVIVGSGRRHRYSHAGQLYFSCPGPNHANGDRDPSGSLTDDPTHDCAGIYCHNLCDPSDIAAGFGFDLGDLFDNPIQKREHAYPPDTSPRAAVECGWMWCVKEKGHRVVAGYNYDGPDGRLIAQKLRCDHKDFAWRRLDPASKNGWRYNRQGVDVRLYRPGVVAWAIRAEHTLYLVEGESDADALHARKIPATTSPDGAGKWRAEFTEMLRGAHLVVVADRDKAGKAHAELVMNAVIDVVGSLEVVVAAEGKDASDHFAAGHGLADLVTVSTPKPFVLVLPPEVQAEVDAYRHEQAQEIDGVLVDMATGEVLGAPSEAV